MLSAYVYALFAVSCAFDARADAVSNFESVYDFADATALVYADVTAASFAVLIALSVCVLL